MTLAILSVLLGNLAFVLPGFLIAYLLRFRSRRWGAYLLVLGILLALMGYAAAFSVAGVVLLLLGVTLFGAGAEGIAFPARAQR